MSKVHRDIGSKFLIHFSSIHKINTDHKNIEYILFFNINTLLLKLYIKFYSVFMSFGMW
jgi:hypothetical protein